MVCAHISLALQIRVQLSIRRHQNLLYNTTTTIRSIWRATNSFRIHNHVWTGFSFLSIFIHGYNSQTISGGW